MNSCTFLKSKIHLLFPIVCTLLFIYQANECVQVYLNQKPLSSTFEEKQQLNPMPSICIEPNELNKTKFDLQRLTPQEYKDEGKWRSEHSDIDEAETYNFLSSSFDALVGKIEVDKTTSDKSDAYTMLEIKEGSDGYVLTRCDYYYALKCFCINFSKEVRKHGIQRATIYFNSDLKFLIVAPKNYYSFNRKHSEFVAETGFIHYVTMSYSIRQAINNQVLRH